MSHIFLNFRERNYETVVSFACGAPLGRSADLCDKRKKTYEEVSLSCGALEGTRTPDLSVRSRTLYPAELPAHIGGEQGIRTLDTGLCPYTRLAGERLRPTRPTLHYFIISGTSYPPKNIGGGGGIRTHGTLIRFNGFQDRLLKPLGHLSNNGNLMEVLIHYIKNPFPCQSFLKKKSKDYYINSYFFLYNFIRLCVFLGLLYIN